MNILYVCADRGIPIRGHKGAAVHVRMLCNAFSRAGHAVTIMTPRPGPEDGPAPEADIIRVPLPPKPATAPDEAIASEKQARAYAGTLLAAAEELLTRRHFDFIYERYSLWSDVGAQLSQKTGTPLILEVNAPLRLEASRYRALADPQTAAHIEATQFQSAFAITAVSQKLADYVIEQGAEPARVHVLPNGVDPTTFHPAVNGGHVRDRYGLHNRVIVGFAGRARPWHDLPTLIRAFAELHAENLDYHLLLVGQMPDDLPELLKRRGLHHAVTMTGPVAHSAVPEHLAAMDVAVSTHADLDDFYFSPLKLFEYLACRVPTVAADIGQPAEIIEDGQNGYLYPPGDAQALAGRIRDLVHHPMEARRIAWQGAVRVLQEHTWDKNAERVINWLRPQPPASTPVSTLPILDHKLRQRLSGIRHMTRLPDLVFIVDVCQEDTAVREANRLNIPVVAMVDTNCDPTNIDYIIPANDDAIRSIKLIVNLMADAVEEGLRLREKLLAEQQAEAQAQEAPVEEEAEEVPVEAYLGESTLRKIRAQSEEAAEAEAAQPAASEAATAQAPEAQGEPTGEAVEEAIAEADDVEERA